MSIKLVVRGSYQKTKTYLSKGIKLSPQLRQIFDKYGKIGVERLNAATPKDTGMTAYSWDYELKNWGIWFKNTNVIDGIPVVILLQYGHLTKAGYYKQGTDFINPVLKSIFDDILNEVNREVKNL
jgi:hypothetical protein